MKILPLTGNKLLKEILFTCIIFLIFLFVAELFVRIFIPVSDQLYTTDEFIGIKLIPNNTGYWVSSEYKTEVKTNALGFREKEYSAEKKNYRIAVLGDSYTEALQVSFEKTFSKLLESKLNSEVINFGVSGQGTAQELLTFENYAKKFNPDLTILMFLTANDVHDNSFELNQRKDRPYFLIQNGELVEGTEFTAGGDIRSSWIKTVVMQNSKFASLMFKEIYKLFSLSNPCSTEVGIYSKNYNKTWESAWEITEKLLKKMNNETNLLVVIIDDKFEVSGSEINTGCTYELDAAHPRKKILDICEKENLNCLDLTPVFSEHFNETGDTAHLKMDGHWSEKGHELAANAVYDKLTE